MLSLIAVLFLSSCSKKTSVSEFEIIHKSSVPSAGSSPYPDCLYSVQVRATKNCNGLAKGDNAVLFLWAFKERRYVNEAFIKVGDKISAHIEPMTKYPQLRSMQRSDDTENFELPIFWCEKLIGPPPKPDYNLLFMGDSPGAPMVPTKPALASEAMKGMVLFLNESFKKKSIRFAVVIPPFKEELKGDYPVIAGYDPSLAEARKQLLSDLMKQGVAVVDLDSTLMKSSVASRVYYPNSDNHLTEIGIEVAARALAEDLRKRGWANSSAAQTTFKVIEQRLGTSEFMAHQVQDANGNSLNLEPAGTRVRLIGDSLLRYPESTPYGSSGSSNIAAHLSKELGHVVGNFTVSQGSAIMPALLKRYPDVWKDAETCIFVISPYYAFVDNSKLWNKVDF